MGIETIFKESGMSTGFGRITFKFDETGQPVAISVDNLFMNYNGDIISKISRYIDSLSQPSEQLEDNASQSSGQLEGTALEIFLRLGEARIFHERFSDLAHSYQADLNNAVTGFSKRIRAFADSAYKSTAVSYLPPKAISLLGRLGINASNAADKLTAERKIEDLFAGELERLKVDKEALELCECALRYGNRTFGKFYRDTHKLGKISQDVVIGLNGLSEVTGRVANLLSGIKTLADGQIQQIEYYRTLFNYYKTPAAAN